MNNTISQIPEPELAQNKSFFRKHLYLIIVVSIVLILCVDLIARINYLSIQRKLSDTDTTNKNELQIPNGMRLVKGNMGTMLLDRAQYRGNEKVTGEFEINFCKDIVIAYFTPDKVQFEDNMTFTLFGAASENVTGKEEIFSKFRITDAERNEQSISSITKKAVVDVYGITVPLEGRGGSPYTFNNYEVDSLSQTKITTEGRSRYCAEG